MRRREVQLPTKIMPIYISNDKNERI